MGFSLGSAFKAVTDPIGAATGGSVLDFIPGIGDKRAQEDANRQNIRLTQMNNEWMERMSNSAYQRSMADMKKAGLNPLLAYQQGGASVPNLQTPTAQAASGSRLGDAALGAFTGISAAQTQRQQANTAQASSESSIALQGVQSANTAAQTQKTIVDAELAKEKIKSEKVRRTLDQTSIPLKKVSESAASLAQKGIGTLDKISNSILKNTAKPSVDAKTLKYQHPFKPKSFQDSMRETDDVLFKRKN